MLIDADVRGDLILCLVASVHNNYPTPERIQKGIFQIGHFGSSSFLSSFEAYPEFEVKGDYFGAYGVCDHWEQILEKCPEIRDSEDRKFVITVTSVRRADQPRDGGWRWHKWGEYIGNKDPQYEYLHDEPEIEEVFVYHVYEKV